MKQKTHEQKMEEMKIETKALRSVVRAMKEKRKEQNRPTIWYNAKTGCIEIHFENKTILTETTNIDRETPRDASDDMAKGSGYKQIIYQTEEEKN